MYYEQSASGTEGGTTLAKDTKDDLDYRKKRIKRIKKIIIALCMVLIILPIVLSIFLLCRVIRLEHKMETIISENGLEAGNDGLETDIVKAEEKKGSASGSAVETEEPKKVYLTFDDGPSKETKKVLDILKKKEVKATFFTIGREDEFSQNMYKRIVKEGHTLGMHSYSHIYKEIYGSIEGFKSDYKKISEYLQKITGVKSVFYRFPGGSSNSINQFPIADYTAFLSEEGVTYMDWNVIAANGTTDHVSEEDMVKSVMDGVSRYDTSIVLLYDSADKKMTAKSLEAIIDNLKAEGYQILPIDENTVPLHHS